MNAKLNLILISKVCEGNTIASVVSCATHAVTKGIIVLIQASLYSDGHF